MNQALYARMNNKRKKKEKKCLMNHTESSISCRETSVAQLVQKYQF
jgi:hypothetical protein